MDKFLVFPRCRIDVLREDERVTVSLLADDSGAEKRMDDMTGTCLAGPKMETSCSACREFVELHGVDMAKISATEQRPAFDTRCLNGPINSAKNNCSKQKKLEDKVSAASISLGMNGSLCGRQRSRNVMWR